LDTAVEAFDRIAVLERGRLVELDGPKELLARPRGVFRGLWDSRM
jgi:ABC-type multidrug transport system fused ATPase/permease subunit